MKNGKLYVKSNSFTELMPVVVLFKAMGCEQDQEILQYIGTEAAIIEKVFLSFQDVVQNRITNQE